MRFNLQEVRKAAGFKSAKAFAEVVGMPKDTYTGYEQGKTKLTLEMAWQFADALGDAMGRYVSLDELAGREFPAPSFSDPRQTRLNALYDESDAKARASILDAAENAHAASLGRTGVPGEEGAPPSGVMSA